MAKRERDTEVFNEVDDVPRRRSSRKLTLAITDDGVDWSKVPDDRKLDVLTALAGDKDVSDTMREFNKPDVNLLQIIEEKHINFFLDAVEAAECFFIPRMVARKSIGGLPAGAFRIDPDVAKQAFKFKNREKLLEIGVLAANANLPDKIKKLIARVGPGSEFVGRFFVELREQQVSAINLQIKKIQAHHAQHATHPQASPPRTAGRIPKPNGKSTVEQSAPMAEVAAPAVDVEAQIP